MLHCATVPYGSSPKNLSRLTPDEMKVASPSNIKAYRGGEGTAKLFLTFGSRQNKGPT